jgi:hypothetical protein
VNNHNSPEDPDITRFSAILNSRPWHRLSLIATANHDIDRGGLLDARKTEAKLIASWPIRKLRISAEAYYSRRTQGDAERDQLSAFLTIRRDLW